MVRKQVQSRLGVDMSHRKAFIKEQVSACSLPIPFERGPFQPSRSKAVLEAPRGAKGFWPIIATTHLISLDGLAVWFMLDVYLPTVPNGPATQASSVNSITASAVCTVQLAHCLYCAAKPTARRADRLWHTTTAHKGRLHTVSSIFLTSLCCGAQVTKFISGEMKSPGKKPAKQKPAKVVGRVIIVGAGPAGLAAAKHLKVCLIDAIPS